MEVENLFDKHNYVVVQNAISQELADFVKNYFLMKRKVVDQMKYTKIISPFIEYLGVWNDEQVP